MDSIFFYALGLPVFLAVVVLGTLLNNFLKVRFKKGAAELKDIAELPGYINDLFAGSERELTELGFEFSHCQLNEKPFVIPYSQEWMKVYCHKKETAYAALSLSSVADPSCPCAIEFITIFSDGHRLSTVSGLMHAIVGSLPDTTLLDPYTESLKSQWECHLKGLAGLKRQRTPVIRTSFEFVESYARGMTDYVEALELKRWLRKVESNEYQLTFSAAFASCFKSFSGMFKYQTLQEKRLKAYKAGNNLLTLPEEVEIRNYYNRTEIFKGRRTGRLKISLLFLITLVLFYFYFGLTIDFKTIFILLAVIFFHELGHFWGMRLFGQKNSKIFFIPFIGAATTGMDKNMPARQKIVIYFLGPLPGIILGLLLMFLPATHDGLFRQIAGALLFINYFNLLPIMPMDGGQIVNLFLSRIPGLQVVFQVLCGVLAIIAGEFLKHDWVFLGIGLALIIGGIAQWPNVALILKLRRKIKAEKLEASENVILPEIFRLLSKTPFNELQFEKKHIMVKFLLENSVVSLPSIKLIVSYLAVYLIIFVLPVIAVLGIAVSSMVFHNSAGKTAFYYPQKIIQRDKNLKLLPEEEALAAKVGFDPKTLLLIKQIAKGNIRQLEGVDQNNQAVKVNGILASAPEISSRDVAANLRFGLMLGGYLVFAADNEETGLIGVLKGNDQFEILRVMNTNGANYGRNNREVIAKLQEWSEKYPFQIIGAGGDWVEIEFSEVPQELGVFAQEVYDFCPDSIDQGTGSISALERSISASKRLFLWWD